MRCCRGGVWPTRYHRGVSMASIRGFAGGCVKLDKRGPGWAAVRSGVDGRGGRRGPRGGCCDGAGDWGAGVPSRRGDGGRLALGQELRESLLILGGEPALCEERGDRRASLREVLISLIAREPGGVLE